MKIVILTKKDDKKAQGLSSDIKNYLERRGHKVAEKVELADFILTLGGDGTIIHNASKYSDLEIPIFGINTGKLGFLAAVEAFDWQKAVDNIISGKVFISERIFLSISIGDREFKAVNEAVIKGLLRVIELELAVGAEEFLRVYGDGVIVATQTGSTAYSLSAGGPIVDSDLNSFIVTPINPIGLPIPSAVLSGDDQITVKVINGEDVSLIIDGQHREKIEKGSMIKIKKSDKKIKLGYFSRHHFLNNLNLKFGLSTRSI